MTRLGERTWPEVAEQPSPTLFVPLGSTEQHGPHLPLDTDTRIAVAWAEGLSAQVPHSVVAPAVAFGSSGEHEGFAGTISIGQEALELVVVELVRSAQRWAGEVVLVCGHGGNAEPVNRAVTRLQAEGRAVRAVFPRLRGDAHAGRTETSLLLHLWPDLVRSEDAEPGCTEPLAALMERLRIDGIAGAAPNGVLGDPTGASSAEGEALFRRLLAPGS